MRIIVATLFASASSLLAISVANAADAVEQIPQAPVAYEQPAPVGGNWEGFYLGGYAGYDWGRFGAGGNNSADSFGGGVYTGYNFQDGQIVYGVEGDVGYNGEKGNAGRNAAGERLRGKAGWNGSVRARVGYDLNPFLIYGTAGLAVQNSELKDATSKDDKTAVGYTVGAGAEAFVTDNITTRLEYRYSDFGNERYSLDSGKFSKGYDDHSVKVGIGVKF